ncbi:MAG: GerAB/ArcD/ProY family transporter [Eubacterium sp.]|nr:GerAB/ArcD/ProY family transporter [Eubacterium sp.]
MNKISWKQLVALFVTTRVSAEMLTIPGELIRYGTDRFWSILAAKLAVLVLFLPLLFLTMRFKGDNFLTPAIRRSKIFGGVLAVIFTAALAMVTLETLINLQLYISDVIFNDMLFITGVIIISAAAFYGALKGFSAISRCSIFALVIFAVLLILIAVTSGDTMDFTYLYPSFVRDNDYFVRSMLAEISSCSEILVFAVFCGNIRTKPNRAVFFYLAAALAVLEGLTLLYNLALGPYLTALEYPMYYISSLSDIVVFQRLDGIDAVVWVLCGIIKLAVLLAAAHNIFTSFGKAPDKIRQTVILAVYTAAVLAAAYYLGTDKGRYDQFEAVTHLPIHIVAAGTLIPLVVLIAGKKKPTAKGEEKNEKA